MPQFGPETNRRRIETIERATAQRLTYGYYGYHAERIIRSDVDRPTKERKLSEIPVTALHDVFIAALDQCEQDIAQAVEHERQLDDEYELSVLFPKPEDLDQRLSTLGESVFFQQTGKRASAHVAMERRGPLFYMYFASDDDFFAFTNVRASGVHAPQLPMTLGMQDDHKIGIRLNCILVDTPEETQRTMDHEQQHYFNRVLGVVHDSDAQIDLRAYAQARITDELLAFIRDGSMARGMIAQDLFSSDYTDLFSEIPDAAPVIQRISDLLTEIHTAAVNLGVREQNIAPILVYSVGGLPLKKIPATLQRIRSLQQTNPKRFLTAVQYPKPRPRRAV
jgi:hypothetical protein